MDKAQKQLIDTYVRKRNISSNNDYYNYKEYELKYFYNNGFIKIDENINQHTLAALLIKFPEDIDKFSKYLNKLDKTNISRIISIKPELIIYLHNRLDELSVMLISIILKNQPQLFKVFKKIIDKKFDIQDKHEFIFKDNPMFTLEYNPNDFSYNQFDSYLKNRNLSDKDRTKLFNHFDGRLRELSSDGLASIIYMNPNLIYWMSKYIPLINDSLDITDILSAQPKLIEYFKDNLKYLDNDQISHLTELHPEMRKYFN